MGTVKLLGGRSQLLPSKTCFLPCVVFEYVDTYQKLIILKTSANFLILFDAKNIILLHYVSVRSIFTANLLISNKLLELTKKFDHKKRQITPQHKKSTRVLYIS